MKYYLGLDIGTDSVGYAVTDEAYNILKFKGEPAWGVHLFETANTAEDRRAYRTNRRRIDRRQQRVQILQELFAGEIFKIDSRFFIRLQESALFPEDKDEKYSLFNDVGYSDKEYHKTYPTIHHLIDELMSSPKPHDVRLVYLACAWLVAHRGHFLSDVDRDHIAEVTDFSSVYSRFENYFLDRECIVPWAGCDLNAFAAALRSDETLQKKSKKLLAACFEKGKVPDQLPGEFPYGIEEILLALCGRKVKAKDLFQNQEYAEIDSISLGSDDETLARIMSQLGEDAGLIERMKELYDWSVLVNVLGSNETVSRSKVVAYDQHKQDLSFLKHIIQKYCPESFDEVFRSTKKGLANYVAYSYHNAGEEMKKVSQEDFCKYISGIIGKITPEAEEKISFDAMSERLKTGRFMPKQRNTDNRVIPHQLYWHELDALLKNAEVYLPFLSDKDETGKTVSDKIKDTFLYRIPYYVGPLGKHGDHAWAVRREGGRVYPWNFEEKIDLDGSEEQFIRRMVNHCTYLPNEYVLPKDSLMYHRFTVLNEINKLKINDALITVEQKQEIYNELFLKRKTVKMKHLRDFLLSRGWMQKGDILSGVDAEGEIKSDLKPQHDFRRLLERGLLTEMDAERIIARRTYTEDNLRFRKWLKREYASLPENDINYLGRLRYKDFGRLSARFLNGLEGVHRGTGEITTILAALWNTNSNLMELLSDEYSFRENAEAEFIAYYSSKPLSLSDQLSEMYISNSVKRPIIRTMEIVKEVMKAFECAPEKIFVEMARGGLPEKKGMRTLARKQQILALYDRCNQDVRDLRDQLEAMGDEANSRLQSDKLFLYYMQLGRCMYTQEVIDIDAMMRDDSIYNIDHIYPQALVKDDSVLNNKVLVRSDVNGQKKDELLPTEIRVRMRPFWDLLKQNGLLNEEKYKRLIRTTPFSSDEKWGFINRQLTETTQATKAVASLLKNLCPDTEIVYVKARLTSEFRQEFDCLKCREVNDLHHAKDAYLNVVTGNVYHERFNQNWFNINETYSVSTKALFTRPLKHGGRVIWDGKAMLERVINTVRNRNSIHLTRYAFIRNGGLFDQQPVKKAEGLVPRKAGMPTEKYGGYCSPSISFFVLAQYETGKKQETMIVPVERMYADRFQSDEHFAEQYIAGRIKQIRGTDSKAIRLPLGRRIIRINTVFSMDGYRFYVTGVDGYGTRILPVCFLPVLVGYEWEIYIKRIASLCAKADENTRYHYDARYDKVTAEKNLNLYDLYIKKLQNPPFSRRPNNPVKTLISGRNVFASLEVIEQAKTLRNIQMLFSRLSGGVDLRAIGGKAKEGAPRKSSSLSNWLKDNRNVYIINQSASGLWETQSCNLLGLLNS